MKIFVVITASLIEENWDERYNQYTMGINQAIKLFKEIPNVYIVIVENTGKTSSFLDSFGVPVLYTNTNNEINSPNKGIKEILDVFKAIKEFNIQDDDFLIKLTGRYFIHDNSKFIDIIKEFHTKSYDAVLKYGGYNLPQIYMEKFYSCITGVVGMKVKYVKMIEIPDDVTCIEWNWAKVANTLDYENLCILNDLGITQYISIGPVVTS